MRRNNNWFERTIAAAYFALAACIPTLAVFIFVSGWNISDYFLFEVPPILAAFASGYFIGWRILDTDRTTSVLGAIKWGLIVTIVTYIIFGIIVSVPIAWLDMPDQFSIIQLVQSIFVTLVILFVYGPILIAPIFILMLVVGGGAGAVLYGVRGLLKQNRTTSVYR